MASAIPQSTETSPPESWKKLRVLKEIQYIEGPDSEVPEVVLRYLAEHYNEEKKEHNGKKKEKKKKRRSVVKKMKRAEQNTKKEKATRDFHFGKWGVRNGFSLFSKDGQKTKWQTSDGSRRDVQVSRFSCLKNQHQFIIARLPSDGNQTNTEPFIIRNSGGIFQQQPFGQVGWQGQEWIEWRSPYISSDQARRRVLQVSQIKSSREQPIMVSDGDTSEASAFLDIRSAIDANTAIGVARVKRSQSPEVVPHQQTHDTDPVKKRRRSNFSFEHPFANAYPASQPLDPETSAKTLITVGPILAQPPFDRSHSRLKGASSMPVAGDGWINQSRSSITPEDEHTTDDDAENNDRDDGHHNDHSHNGDSKPFEDYTDSLTDVPNVQKARHETDDSHEQVSEVTPSSILPLSATVTAPNAEEFPHIPMPMQSAPSSDHGTNSGSLLRASPQIMPGSDLSSHIKVIFQDKQGLTKEETTFDECDSATKLFDAACVAEVVDKNTRTLEILLGQDVKKIVRRDHKDDFQNKVLPQLELLIKGGTSDEYVKIVVRAYT